MFDFYLLVTSKKSSHGIIKCVKVQGVNVDIYRYILQCNVKKNNHFVGDNTHINKSKNTCFVVQSTQWRHTYQLVIMITKWKYYRLNDLLHYYCNIIASSRNQCVKIHRTKSMNRCSMKSFFILLMHVFANKPHLLALQSQCCSHREFEYQLNKTLNCGLNIVKKEIELGLSLIHI